MASLSEFDREQAILLELDQHGRVVVAELSIRFGVSAVTIRKDLENLERRSMLRRIRGGALVAQRSDEGAFEFRQRVAPRAKRAIARRAAELVHPGDVIAMDSSTTCFYLAEELVDITPLTVITNGLRASAYLLSYSTATVIMPGGVLRRASESMVGFFGGVLDGRGRVDKGFFGLVGLSLQRGLLDITPEEAHAKEAMAAVCRQVYGLFDSTKVERFGTHPFVTVEQVTGLTSDTGVPVDIRRQWTEAGVTWDLVDPEAAAPAAQSKVTSLRDAAGARR
ncbi:MAG: DeoR/GlpR family DNA-binding transcription regulator [Acidimicrobiales bacterium]